MWEPDTLRAGPAGPGRSEDGRSGKRKKGSAEAAPRAYGRLTRHERDTVQRMLERRASCREIARELGRSPSAVSASIAQGELRHLRHTAVQPLNLCHRAHGASPFRHGIVSSTRPLPIRTNITRQGEAPEGRAPQHEAESAPGWTGQQRRSTRNRRGVTTVPASVSLGQVMMPTNPEMLQRSAERA